MFVVHMSAAERSHSRRFRIGAIALCSLVGAPSGYHGHAERDWRGVTNHTLVVSGFPVLQMGFTPEIQCDEET
jgi:hypothetical protein